MLQLLGDCISVTLVTPSIVNSVIILIYVNAVFEVLPDKIKL